MVQKISPSILVGLVVGIIGVLLSFAGRGINPGRVLADPMPVILSFTQLTRGLLYWNWQGVLIHVFFYLFLPTLSMIGLYFWHNGAEDFVEQAVVAGRITAVINVGIVAIKEVDAFSVGVYYVFGGFLMVWISGVMAKWLANKFNPQK